MWQRFTERARRAIFFAQEEATSHGVGWVGPECVLLGLIRDEEAVAVRMLRVAGVAVADLRARLGASLSAPTAEAGRDLQLTPTAKRAIDTAYDEARALGDRHIGTEHLLLGLAQVESVASAALAELGVTVEALRRHVPEAPKTGDGSVSPLADTLRSDALGLRGQSLLSMADLTREQALGILSCAQELRDARATGEAVVDWHGRKSLAMVFEKASLRTRVTFELGMKELGGVPIVLGPAEIGLGVRESVADVARNLDRWVTAVAARVISHQTLEGLRRHSSVPIINALSDREHPCQTLADLQALLQRKGRLDGLRIAWVGDGNNVLHSLMLGAALTGASVVAACPAGYEPDPAIVERARALAGSAETVEVVTAPLDAVRGADAVYTDVWVSMGHEAETATRKEVFAAYQVDAKLMGAAGTDAVFMHCLPAHRGEEVTDEVLDAPMSIVLDQAENRLHAQKALLALLIGP